MYEEYHLKPPILSPEAKKGTKLGNFSFLFLGFRAYQTDKLYILENIIVRSSEPNYNYFAWLN
jgi:hypothetical protein